MADALHYFPMAPSGKVRIGISGWTYKPWRGVFYPEDLSQKRELEYASKTFNSIEINGTFYSLQRPTSFERWAAETPDDFVFSVKAPRFITHMRRLKDVDAPVSNFLASGIFNLGQKLGPILWQLPPNFLFKPEILEAFFKLLPHDTEEAAAVARRHDKWMSGRAALEPGAKRPLRHAMEIRHASFATPEFINLLRKYDVALVCADTVEWPRLMDLTSDFMYCRLHGSEVLYASGYDDESLDQWSARVHAWLRGKEPEDAERVIREKGPKRPARDVFVYFDNDAKVRAPFDAKSLTARMNKLLAK
jgi:uncharacterized protein YecE (DUF72 family)